MHTYRYILTILLCAWSIVALSLEKTILLGPKTIGKAWRDNIVLEPRHFADAKAGDIVTVYNDNAKGSAQGAFQNPSNWHGVAHEYDYFGIAGPFRMVLTEDILSIANTVSDFIRNHEIGGDNSTEETSTEDIDEPINFDIDTEEGEEE